MVLAVAFDNAAMGADQLGDKRQTEARTIRLGGDERIEKMRQEIGGYARAIVMHAEFQRKRDALPAAGNR